MEEKSGRVEYHERRPFLQPDGRERPSMIGYPLDKDWNRVSQRNGRRRASVSNA